MEGNACLKAKLTFPSVPQNKTIESVFCWNRKGECLFWVFISCRKLPSYVISLTAGSQNGPQYSSRKIYHRGKATSFRQIHVHVLRRFIRNKIGQINYPIQHFQGKQSKPETHKYFKRRSFSKNLAEIKCLWPRRVTNKCIRTILTDHAWGKLICFPRCTKYWLQRNPIRPLQDNLKVNADLSRRLLFPSRNQMQIACLHLRNILESFNFHRSLFLRRNDLFGRNYYLA